VIKLELTAQDLAKVRFTSDAVWETASSLSLINHRQHFQLHRHLRLGCRATRASTSTCCSS
jgi:hypothetical protein